MKNSLFKRAFAVAAAVPLALTQCLTAASAVNVSDSAQVLTDTIVTADKETVTVGKILEIYPGFETVANEDKYTPIGAKITAYEKESDWNETITGYLQMMTEGKETTDVLNLSSIYEQIISRSGKYADITRSITEKIGEASYTIDTENNITINASMSDIVPIFEEVAQEKVGGDLKALADKYDMPELADVKFFEGLEIKGDIKVTINASSLMIGTTVSGNITFTDTVTGTEYKGMAILDYMLAQVDALQATATETVDGLVDKYNLTDEELEKMVQDSDEYKELIQNLKDGYTPESGEIETMILESIEFQNLVNDYMADHGVDYAEAEARIKDSEDYSDMLERFTNGINLSESEIVAILEESDEYNALVENYMAENGVDISEAQAAVVNSADYQALLEKYTDKYTYTDEEVEAMVKGSADYQAKMAEIQAEYDDTYADMTKKADDALAKVEDMVSYAKGKINMALDKYETAKTLTGTKGPFANYAAMAEAVNESEKFQNAVDYAQDKVDKVTDKVTVPDRIPTTVPTQVPTDLDGVASKHTVQKIFAEIINQIAAKSTLSVSIAPEDITALIESATEITVSYDSNGVVTYVCKLPDEEASEASSYILDTYSDDVLASWGMTDGEVKVSDCYKQADVKLDYSAFDADGNAKATIDLKRVVEVTVEEVETTTTTTTTTTGTETETSTSSETSTTTTETETSTSSETSTTTTGTETGTGSESSTTTTGTETGTGSESSTTTTGTETGTGSESSTTTTGTETGTGSESSTTTTETGTGTGSESSTSTTGTETGTGSGSESSTTTTETGTGTGSESSTSTTGTETGTGSGSESSTTSTETTSGNGEETTTSVSESQTVSVTVETVDGFYLSIEEEFDKSQVKSITYVVNTLYTYVGEDGEVISTETVETATGEITADQIAFNDTPSSVYESGEFIDDITIYAAEDIVAENGVVIAAAGEAIVDAEGNEATMTVYVGLKGDANLDRVVDSVDASLVLGYYSAMQTGEDPETFLVNDGDEKFIDNPILDQFGAFLADVDNERDPNNRFERKSERYIDAADASPILSMYALTSTGEPSTREVWDIALS